MGRLVQRRHSPMSPSQIPKRRSRRLAGKEIGEDPVIEEPVVEPASEFVEPASSPQTTATNDKSYLQALDEALSWPIQQVKLGPLDYILALPDGELGFAPKMVLKVVPRFIPLLALAHFLWLPVFPAAVVVLIWTMIPLGLLKGLFKRQRPISDLGSARMVVVRSHVYSENDSFPSGCCGLVAATSSVFAVWTGNDAWMCLIPLAMFIRVYFHCHWFFDTAVGACIGMAAASGLQLAFGIKSMDFTHPVFRVCFCGIFVLGALLKMSRPTPKP